LQHIGQSLYEVESTDRPYMKYEPDHFDLIVIDECHRSGFGTRRAILDYFRKGTVLGMIATQKRADNIDTYILVSKLRAVSLKDYNLSVMSYLV
jgi:type I site-specific restriction endonuclease